MRENICKWNRQGTSLQNIQTIHTAQDQRTTTKKIKSNGWKILIDLSPKKIYRQRAKRHKKGSSVSLITAAAKSLQSCPTLYNPIDGSPSSFPSLEFSRQEHWSGVPFPSPMHESEKWKWSCSVMSDSSDPMDCSLPGSSVHGIFQAKTLEWGAVRGSLNNKKQNYRLIQ